MPFIPRDPNVTLKYNAFHNMIGGIDVFAGGLTIVVNGDASQKRIYVMESFLKRLGEPSPEGRIDLQLNISRNSSEQRNIDVRAPKESLKSVIMNLTSNNSDFANACYEAIDALSKPGIMLMRANSKKLAAEKSRVLRPRSPNTYI